MFAMFEMFEMFEMFAMFAMFRMFENGASLFSWNDLHGRGALLGQPRVLTTQTESHRT